MAKFPVTAAGHAALEEELRQRIRIERPRLVQRIQQAIADGTNLVENSEYQGVRVEQEMNESLIAELEDKLARAEIVDVSKLSGDTILSARLDLSRMKRAPDARRLFVAV
jgi:transcription elongation factor GreA